MGTESHPRSCVKRERSKVEWICYINMELRILLKGVCRRRFLPLIVVMILKVRQIYARMHFFRTQEALKLKLKQQSAREEGICQVMYFQKTKNAMTRDNDMSLICLK